MKRSKTYFMTGLMVLLVFGGICVFGVTASAKDTYTIAVVVHGGTTNPFWKIEEQGLRDLDRKYPEIEVTYLGPEFYNLGEFLDILKAAIASQPDALVCTLTSPELMDDILRPAIAGGLPVIAINAADMREPAEARIPVLTYIGEDSYEVGVIAARETLQRFTPKRALFCNHHISAENIDARGRGWIETMEARGVPAEQLNVTTDVAHGANLLLAYLLNHQETDAIFTVNVERTAAFITQLEANGYQVGQDINIAQMDAEPLILEYIQEGKIMFTLDQQPYLQSYLGGLLAYLHVKYGFVPSQKLISTGPRLITKENMTEVAHFTLPDQLLEQMKHDGIPEKILDDVKTLLEVKHEG